MPLKYFNFVVGKCEVDQTCRGLICGCWGGNVVGRVAGGGGGTLTLTAAAAAAAAKNNNTNMGKNWWKFFIILIKLAKVTSLLYNARIHKSKILITKPL